MKIGFLFAGQGSQAVGMGKDIYDNYEEVRLIYQKVKNLTGINIDKISFEGPESELNKTRYTQLAILTMSLGILEVLKKEGIKPEISAGLSLGEYAALLSSGAISFEDGIKIVQKRGEYMETLLPSGEWQMAAVLGINEKQAEEICSKVTKGFIAPANYNCIGQIVLSGEKEAVLEAETIAKELGAKKVMLLNTAGPFHTEKLVESAKALEKDLKQIEFKILKTKVIKNLDGNYYNDKDDFVGILTNHITHSVRFDKTIELMLEDGVDTFIEIGPGKALSGFVKRTPTDKEIKILNINNMESLLNTIKEAKIAPK